MSLRYPELLPVMRYANNAETRRKLDTANAARSMLENTPLLEETLALRHGTYPSVSQLSRHTHLHAIAEAALLLGYEDHASYVLEDRMAKNPAHVLEFINELSGTTNARHTPRTHSCMRKAGAVFDSTLQSMCSQGGAAGTPGVGKDDRP